MTIKMICPDGVTFVFDTAAEARAFQHVNVPNKHVPRVGKRNTSESVRSAQARHTYQHVEKHQDLNVETLTQLRDVWTNAGIVTSRPTKRLNSVTGRRRSTPAGSPYSVQTVRPWAMAASNAIREGMTLDKFVAEATKKGSTIGSSCKWPCPAHVQA